MDNVSSSMIRPLKETLLSKHLALSQLYVFINSTITIQLKLGVTEHINICFTNPYNEPLV